MGLSATELLIIATVLIVAIGVGVIALNRRRGDTTDRRPAMPAPRPSAQELDGALHDLIRQDKKIQAIKLLREHTDLSLSAGQGSRRRTRRRLPHPLPARHRPAARPAAGPNLASRCASSRRRAAPSRPSSWCAARPAWTSPAQPSSSTACDRADLIRETPLISPPKRRYDRDMHSLAISTGGLVALTVVVTA